MKLISRLSALVAGFCAVCALFGSPTAAHAWSGSSTNPWFTTYTGSYELMTNEWGSTAPLTMYYNNATNWDLYCNFTGGGVKCYSCMQVSTGINIGTTFSANFNGTPNAGCYDESFDDWDSNGNEFMVWESWGGGAGPVGSEIASNVNIDGANWNVYEGNDGHTCISFLRTSQRTSGYEQYVNDFTQWAYYNGKTNDAIMRSYAFGFEVTNTFGWENWTMNSYSASW